MAIAIELTFHGPGATLENYDKSVADMGGTPGGPHPDPACLFHWAAGIGGGFRVIDVFTTKQAFEAFAANKITPAAEKFGIPKPKIEFIDVHNFMTAG